MLVLLPPMLLLPRCNSHQQQQQQQPMMVRVMLRWELWVVRAHGSGAQGARMQGA
jgi:hypothetical protein